MMSRLLDPSLEISSPLTRVTCILVLAYGLWRYIEEKRSPLNAIPTIGRSGVLSSYITALKWTWHATELIQEGYNKYPGQAFKVATISRWIVVLNGKQHVEDVRRASEDVLSFERAAAEVTQKQYMLGLSLDDEPYHTATVRSPLTRNVAGRFEDITDEIFESFKDFIPLTEDWTPISAYDTLLHTVCRTSNRYFVGLPLCRDPGYRSLNETFTLDVLVGAEIINCFPDFLKPLVGRYMTNVPKAVRQALGFLGPTLEARIAQEKQHGVDWEEKPNDLITWLLETATQEHHRNPRDLALRILLVNFVAIHTSTMAATHSLYDLAVHPEYVKDMRNEAEAIIAEYGWTKAALQRMRKIDSFLKESQRMNSGCLVMSRKTLKDWRLSDGTLIPAGTFVSVASDAMNKEEVSFPDAHTFKGFRFDELRNGDGELDAIKHQMVSVEPNQITFGYGRHACPGRFFAVNEIKAIFCHILLNYDVQLENGYMNRPENQYFRSSITPNTKAKVMFRKRRN